MQIHGYSFGAVAPAPLSLADFDRMKSAALFGEGDVVVAVVPTASKAEFRRQLDGETQN